MIELRPKDINEFIACIHENKKNIEDKLCLIRFPWKADLKDLQSDVSLIPKDIQLFFTKNFYSEKTSIGNSEYYFYFLAYSQYPDVLHEISKKTVLPHIGQSKYASKELINYLIENLNNRDHPIGKWENSDAKQMLMYSIALNPTAPPDFLTECYKLDDFGDVYGTTQKKYSFKKTVASNPNTPENILNLLMTEEPYWESLYSNPKLSNNLREQIFNETLERSRPIMFTSISNLVEKDEMSLEKLNIVIKRDISEKTAFTVFKCLSNPNLDDLTFKFIAENLNEHQRRNFKWDFNNENYRYVKDKLLQNENIPYQAKKNFIEKIEQTKDIKKKDKRCFIATSVYGDIESEELILLRKFRDIYLLKSNFGKRFVHSYYLYSPKFVSLIDNKSRTKFLIKWLVLNPIVSIIKFIFWGRK